MLPLGATTTPTFAMVAAGSTLAVVRSTSANDAEFLLLNPNGTAASAPVPIQPLFAGRKFEFDIAPLKNGGYAIAWTSQSTATGDKEAMVQVVGANGQPVSGAVTVASNSVNFQEQPSVAALQDGGFVVAFTDTSMRPDDPDSQAVRAQAFDAAGNKVGAELLVNRDTQGSQIRPDLLTLPDGRILAAWGERVLESSSEYSPRSAILDNRPATLPVGEAGDLVIGHGTGSSLANDAVYSLGGADTVFGLGGDWLEGAAGNDVFFGGDGADVLVGGADADWLVGDAGNDQLYGGDGVDVLQGGEGADWLDAGPGPSNQVYGGAGADTVFAGGGDDWLEGGEGADQLYGGNGANVLAGGGGRDWMVGGAGYDQLYGGDDADVMQGLGGGDWIDGGAGDNSLYGGEGVDTVQAGSGNDWSYGGAGNDLLYGGGGQNALFGDAGADWMVGGSTYDQLYGGADADTLQGGAGGDWIIGGTGADYVIGGAEADTLVASPGELQGDAYGDFAAGEDLLSLQGFGPGAQLVYNGGGSYTLVYAGGAETFTVSAHRVLIEGIDYGIG